ncbi:hypothetical protein AALP_AAs56774U000300 [Arabis alpina]|uniref:DUF1204 domain-containing protein n=1 Tax=Arabis alpina TaxID=50452 RepID=A0A087FWV3_ARAAL|nr:hypothetical protein AALP_AAs56774U000300 [Arabis alpina]
MGTDVTNVSDHHGPDIGDLDADVPPRSSQGTEDLSITNTDGTDDVATTRVTDVDIVGVGSPRNPIAEPDELNYPRRLARFSDDPNKPHVTMDPVSQLFNANEFEGVSFVPEEDPGLPSGSAEVSSSSSSFDTRASSSDEDMFVEVEQKKKAKKVKKKAKVKVRPDPPGSSLLDEKSFRRLRKKCGISEEIVLVAPTLADKADAPPPGYMTLFENYFDQCLLLFSLPRFLMRFLAVHGVCLAQINPRGIRHLLGIYVLSRECGVFISTEHLSYLTDFRVRGRSEELKHIVTNSSGMALIVGFLSKDDHFQDLKPSLPEVSTEFVAAMHTELSSGNGNWRKSFSRRRIERALSTDIFPGKILGRGQANVSFREQVALEAVAKAKGSSGTNTPRVVALMTSTLTALSVRARSLRPLAPKTLLPPPSSGKLAEFCRLSAERARISSGKGKSVDRVTPSKKQRVDTYSAAVVGRETSASHVVSSFVGGLLHDEAYSAVKLKASELSLFLDRLVDDYDEDVRSRDSELGAAKEANAILQSRLDEFAERNEVLKHDALSVQKIKRDCDDKLTKLKSRCTKAEGEIVQLRGELSSASDLQRCRIDDAVAEMARGFAERASEVAGLLAKIAGKVKNDMLNLAEIDWNLEFIGLLQGSEPPDLPTEVKALRERRHLIYDAHDVFADLLASVWRVLEIQVFFAGAAEASVAVDDDVEVTNEDDMEVTNEDDVQVTNDDEDAEDSSFFLSLVSDLAYFMTFVYDFLIFGRDYS